MNKFKHVIHLKSEIKYTLLVYIQSFGEKSFVIDTLTTIKLNILLIHQYEMFKKLNENKWIIPFNVYNFKTIIVVSVYLK